MNRVGTMKRKNIIIDLIHIDKEKESLISYNTNLHLTSECRNLDRSMEVKLSALLVGNYEIPTNRRFTSNKIKDRSKLLCRSK